MNTPTPLTDDWPFLLTLLPTDLEASAREYGALRRQREVRCAADLLRLALVYGFCGLSLHATAVWARVVQVADLSDPALLKRLCGCADWLGHLLGEKLRQRAADLPLRQPRRIRLVDATAISRPGSCSTDFRVHLGFDLRRLQVGSVELTPTAGGETFQRLVIEAGELLIADSAYSRRPGMAAVVAAGGELLVRHHWYDVPLERPDGTPFPLWEALRGLAPAEVGEWGVQTAPRADGLPALPGRLIAVQKSPQAIEEARRKLRQQTQKHGRTPSVESLTACEYVLLFTTVPAAALAAVAALELYRFRWQVELAFKRLKSLLQLDEMTAQKEALCRTFLLAKLLGAVLIDELSHRAVDFSPWGYGSPAAAVPLASVGHDGRHAAARDRGRADLGPMAGAHRGTRAPFPGYAPQTTLPPSG